MMEGVRTVHLILDIIVFVFAGVCVIVSVRQLDRPKRRRKKGGD